MYICTLTIQISDEKNISFVAMEKENLKHIPLKLPFKALM